MRERVNKLKRVVVLKWYSICLAIGSIAYGMYLQIYPISISHNVSYEIITNVLGSDWLASLLIIFGLCKLLFIGINHDRGRLLALSVFIFLWTLVAVGFYIQHINGHINSGWIVCAIIILQAMGISQRGNFNR